MAEFAAEFGHVQNECSAAALLATVSGSRAQAADSTPHVTFTMSPLFDPACDAAIQKPVAEPVVAAAREHLSAWQAECDRVLRVHRDGPAIDHAPVWRRRAVDHSTDCVRLIEYLLRRATNHTTPRLRIRP